MAASTVLAFAIIVNVNAFEDPVQTRFEIFNEITIMLVLYGITGFIPLVEPEPRSVIGILVCLLISFHLFVSISAMLFTSIKQWISLIRLWLAFRRLSKERSAKQAIMKDLMAIRKTKR